MAISASVASIPSLNSSDHSSSLASSSLQFHLTTRPFRFRNGGFCAPLRLRSRNLLVVAEAKKQIFSSFDELLAKSDKPVLVDFYATWCGPCQFMAPVLNEVSITLNDKIQVVKIDTEKYPAIADKYRIEALPTFIIFKDGEPCDRFEGALTANQLVERIESTLQVKQ